MRLPGLKRVADRRARRRGARSEPEAASSSLPRTAGETVRAVGQYLTDGAALFRVVHAIRDARGRTLLLELEDCHTMQLILCEPDAVSRAPLEAVTPASFASDDAPTGPVAEHQRRKIRPSPPYAGLRAG